MDSEPGHAQDSPGRHGRAHSPRAARHGQAAAKAPRPPLTASDQVLALQRSAGNAAVTRMLARDEAPNPYQLQTPSLNAPRPFGSWKRPSPLGDMQLHLDPQIQMQALDAQLQPDALRNLFTRLPLPTLPPPQPNPVTGGPPPPKPTPGPGDRPPGPLDVSPTEQGQGGDVLNALATIPEIKQLSDAAREQLWGRLPTAEKWTLAVSGITVGLAGLGGVLSTPSGRETLAGLSGKPISIPGVPWFAPEFNVIGPNLILGLHVDVGAFLKGRGGFGPQERGPAPLTPQPPER